MGTAGERDLILVTGGSGYVGGRLVGRLLDQGYRVRCLGRSRRKLEARPWSSHPSLEIIEGDLDDSAALSAALQGVKRAFYLVHSMTTDPDQYAETDRRLARHFADAAAAADVQQIVYLGGLGESRDELSQHLRSRREVEHVLAEGAVPVTVFRAGMIIGSGSASFEMLRYLVERLPVMVTPRWLSTRCQPIAIRNVLHSLIACLEEPKALGQTYEIGGPDVFTYREMIQEMAAARGLARRWVIPVPVMSPQLSAAWIHLVTPVSASFAKPLVAGLRNEMICHDHRVQEDLPQALLTVRESIDAALQRMRDGEVESSWSDAGAMPGDPPWAGGTVYVDSRSMEVDAPGEAVNEVVMRIGGDRGWPSANSLWKLRGLLDRLVGGPGLRRGRRDARDLRVGDALDFWRVVRVESGRALELRAEMKLPGVATLTFEIEEVPGQSDRSVLRQTARFWPKGIFGILYWYSIVILHEWVFASMLRNLAQQAVEWNRSATAGQISSAGTTD